MTEKLAPKDSLVESEQAAQSLQETNSTDLIPISRWQHTKAIVALAVVSLAVYAPSLNGVFLLDDHNNIVANNQIQTGVLNPELWTSVRGLTMGTFAINYQLSGLDPRGFHWVNNSIHTLSVVLLYAFSIRLLRNPRSRIRSVQLAAFLIAMLWAVHPLCTQAVTYLVQRAEILMAMSMLGFLIALDHSSVSSRKRRWQWFAVGIFLAGAASKEVMVMALPIGMLYDRLFLSTGWGETLKRRSTVWVGCATLLLVAAAIKGPTLLASNSSVGFSMESIRPGQYVATQPLILLHYIRLMLWPEPLVFDYGWPPETEMWKIALSTAIVFVAAVGCILKASRFPVFAFTILAALLMFVPTSLMPLQDLAVEHRAYLSCGFVLIAIVASLFRWIESSEERSKVLPIALFGGAAFVFALLTVNRNAIYSSRVAMWQDVIDKTQGAGHQNMYLARAYTNLGEAFAEQSEWDQSIDALEHAVQIGGYPQQVHGNLARAYIELNLPNKAAVHIVEAVKRNPKDARTRQQAGLLAIRQKDFETAEKMFSVAAELSPQDEVILFNLAKSQVALGQLELAEANFRRSIELRPSEAAPHYSLIALLARQGKFDPAKQLCETWLSDHPEDGRVNVLLGSLFASEQNMDEAVQHWKVAATQSPPTEQANFLLGNYYLQTGDRKLARQHLEAEVGVDATNVEALVNLGALSAENEPRTARKYFQKALAVQPTYLQADFNIAAIDARLGKRDEATTRLRSIIDRHPNFAPANQLLQALESIPISQ
ncbi:tetratricopeptide repeat protein [Stieleria sp. JC731]|uniref:tetratricopeptide repeat protein n=1 Tax=Pirellulaceae TaxID=2691357 RepID=UPI001E57D521|nr:tetratricopeptide repeat protein [Stieleria sp. JC731]MCC9599046.1 tetratricopeptide repeat protein [Stieleria sp. JC731]